MGGGGAEGRRVGSFDGVMRGAIGLREEDEGVSRLGARIF